MTTIKATVRGRRLDVEVPSDWPDGTEVEIHPLAAEANGVGGMSPDEITATLAAMDKMEPLHFSDAERAAWEAERQARKDREKADFAEHAEGLRRMWE